jgi:predicted ATPase/transcriptional regulator with XRE-family HTH domain/Tfp pilus assembly protein PilF
MASKDRETGRAFGALLKRYRLAAGLSQEVLAERAGMSPRGVKYLESGARLPYPDSLQRLAGALTLNSTDRALLVAAAYPDGVTKPGAAPCRHNLPVQTSSFIGREQEQRAVCSLLEHARLVTLVGPGGVGKTRLALAVAETLVETYPDGVWLVELAALSDPELVPGAVLAALGLREESGLPSLATLTSYLKGKGFLLVLDNCEHLVAACAALADTLLRGHPQVLILATSREGLGVAGESLYRVPSLSVPSPRHLPSVELVPAYEAARLFVARAQARGTGFTLTTQNAPAVVQICARLDGIPLAIELAAARVGALPVEVIATRLDDAFRLLTGGPRTALPRQQTLRAALDWSHDLLSLPEQVLLRRLAVFADGWPLEAAEQVIGAGEVVPREDVLDLLGTLANKSLVLLEEASGHPRYRLLETVRQYAAERLDGAGEAVQVRDQHLAWCVGLAEQAEPALVGAEQEVWLGRLEQEHDNLRAALAWAGERRAGELGLRLAGALWRFWSIRGYLREGRQWLELALAAEGAEAPLARARALNGAGNLATSQGAYARAAALHAEALALRRDLGDQQDIAGSLNNLGNVAYQQGDYAQAATLFAESLALRRELGDRQGIARLLNNLGGVAYKQGNFAQAIALQEDALALERALGDTYSVAALLNNLGEVVCLQGDYARAATLFAESLALKRELDDREGVVYSLHSLATVVYLQGDYERSCTLLREAILLSQEIEARGLLPDALEILAWVIGAQGQLDRAARLGGAAEIQRDVLGVPLPPEQRADHERAVRDMRATLDEAAFAVAWAAGRALSLDQAVSIALSDAPATT